VPAKLKPRIGDVREVLQATRQQVVNGDDLGALSEQPVAQVRAEEAGAARDNDPHRPMPA